MTSTNIAQAVGDSGSDTDRSRRAGAARPVVHKHLEPCGASGAIPRTRPVRTARGRSRYGLRDGLRDGHRDGLRDGLLSLQGARRAQAQAQVVPGSVSSPV